MSITENALRDLSLRAGVNAPRKRLNLHRKIGQYPYDTVLNVYAGGSGSYGAIVNATDRRFDLPLVHVWTLQDGKVKRFVNFTDTAKVAEAYSVEGGVTPTWKS